jgi:non-ribosomal peptide synthase protein (TIGR01720 family)
VHDIPRLHRARADEVLLAALAQAVADWSGRRRFLAAVEGHGREEVADGVDLSRTVGWFTSLAPVLLEGRPGDPGACLAAVKETLRSMPRRGIGHGLLRHLGDAAARDRLARMPQPDILFNYLGQFDSAGREGHLRLRDAHEARGRESALGGPAGARLGMDGIVIGGRLRLVFRGRGWTSPEMDRLAQAYAKALDGFLADGPGRRAAVLTPADFPLAKLDQATLEKLRRKVAGR